MRLEAETAPTTLSFDIQTDESKPAAAIGRVGFLGGTDAVVK
jgi:hypothetical protein